MTYAKQRKGWRMNCDVGKTDGMGWRMICDVGEVKERLENEQKWQKKEEVKR